MAALFVPASAGAALGAPDVRFYNIDPWGIHANETADIKFRINDSLPQVHIEVDFHHIGSPAADRHLDLGQQPTNQRVTVKWKPSQRAGLPTGTYTATMTVVDALNRTPVIVPIAWIKLRRN